MPSMTKTAIQAAVNIGAAGRRSGITIKMIRCYESIGLLALRNDSDRASAEVKALVTTHIAVLDKRIAALRDMRSILARLAESCGGNDRPDCPIIDELAGARE